MKKRIAVLLMASAAMLFGCAGKADAPAAPAKPAEDTVTETEEAAPAGIANPWRDSDRETTLQALGFDMAPPEGSSNVSYQINESIGLGQLLFTYGDPGLEYTFRMQSTAEFQDISGLNYSWDNVEDTSIEWCEGKFMRTNADGVMIDLCLWYDVVPGIMYSLSTQSADLDGFDITAVADGIFLSMRGDGEEFIPANFLEEKLQQGTFGSFDEIIAALESGNAYSIVKINGYDGDVLIIAEGAYDNGDGTMASMDGSLYIQDGDLVKNIGNTYSEGTAYPISLDAEGRIFSGGNHEVNVECISNEKALMIMTYAYEYFDDKGNAVYGGFTREANNFDAPDTEIAEEDPTVLEGLFAEYEKTTPVNYTVVK